MSYRFVSLERSWWLSFEGFRISNVAVGFKNVCLLLILYQPLMTWSSPDNDTDGYFIAPAIEGNDADHNNVCLFSIALQWSLVLRTSFCDVLAAAMLLRRN